LNSKILFIIKTCNPLFEFKCNHMISITWKFCKFRTIRTVLRIQDFYPRSGFFLFSSLHKNLSIFNPKKVLKLLELMVGSWIRDLGSGENLSWILGTRKPGSWIRNTEFGIKTFFRFCVPKDFFWPGYILKKIYYGTHSIKLF
jgi:hypothetical protein